MTKEVWNKESVAKVLEGYAELSGVKVEDFTVTENVKKGDILYIHEEDREIGFCPLMCNNPDMPDDTVRLMLMTFFCALAREPLGLTWWSDCQDHVKILCEKTGIEYIDFFDTEDYVRPVRRKLFPNPKDGGSFFRIGDILRNKAPCSGGCKYTVTDMKLTEEGIMISYRVVPSKYFPDNGRIYIEEEATVFDRFYLYERAE